MKEDLLNVMGSFSGTALDCIEKQNEEIEDLKKENARLKDKNKKAIEKLEFYNSGEALWYVPIQEIIDILKEN